MWYFAWVLGVGLAMAFGIINVMWWEAQYFSKIGTEEARVGNVELISSLFYRSFAVI